MEILIALFSFLIEFALDCSFISSSYIWVSFVIFSSFWIIREQLFIQYSIIYFINFSSWHLYKIKNNKRSIWIDSIVNYFYKNLNLRLKKI